MKKSTFYIVFFLVLLLLFWLALSKFTPYFSQSKLSKRSTVQPFSFINQDGASFTNADMLGKVCVVEYFFTTCQGICPKMNHNMKDMYETFKSEKDFLIVSHTCQPEVDSVPLLKAYSQRMNSNNINWVFVTGSKDNLYKMARFSYGLDDPKNAVTNIADDFIHTQFFSLIDKNGNVRGGVYDGLKKEDLDKLKEDIRGLLTEKPLKNNFNGVFGN
jgi:protein SCO1/2